MKTNSSYTVLVVDDDDVYREDTRRLLGEGSYTLIEAATGRDALNKLGSHQVHCVLLDYRLPDLDGLKLLPKLVELQVPVVMMTAEGNELVAVEAMKQGAYDYLVKNTLTEDALRTSIKKAIDHANLEKKVREQQQELELFASMVSHDLKSPLQSIMACITFIKEDIETSNTEQLLKDCQRARRGVEHMHQLIDGLLEYTQSERSSQAFETVSLNAVAAQVVSALEATVTDLAAQITVENLPEVNGDRIALYQLLQNLVTNGLKFHNGSTTPCVRIAASRISDDWQISVEDNGIGINAKHCDKIFEPFKRLHSKDQYDGCGLGLAMCKRVVDQHGGRIWLESEVGKGTTFYFTIPLNVTSERHLEAGHTIDTSEAA